MNRRFLSFLMLSLFLPAMTAQARGLDSARTIDRFTAEGGQIETLGGQPIDTSLVDLSTLPGISVHPGHSPYHVRLEKRQGGLEVTVLDERNEPLMARTLAASSPTAIQLASLKDMDNTDIGAALVTGFLTGACLSGLPACPLVAAIVITRMAIGAFERYDQRHHPVPAKP